MKPKRNLARQRLKDSTRAEYENLIYEAKLTLNQEEIIKFHILRDYSICKIALSFSCSESLVRKTLSSVYEKNSVSVAFSRLFLFLKLLS